MALPRVCASFGHSLVSRGCTRTAFFSTRIAAIVPQRQLSSKPWRLWETVQDDAPRSEKTPQPRTVSDEERARNARSVIIKRLPKRALHPQVEELFRNAGLDIKFLKMRMNRFNYFSDVLGFAELASPEQAQEAISKLSNSTALDSQSPIFVDNVNPYFSWDPTTLATDFSYWESYDSDGVSRAMAPLLEQRRVAFGVVPPGWAQLDQKIRRRNAQNRHVVIRALSEYGVESVGSAAVNWGDLRQKPRFLCHVDFATKEGAEQAVRDLHEKTVEGRTVGLRRSEVSLSTAYRIGQLDRGVLKQLQEMRVAPAEVDDEMLSKPFVSSHVREKHGES
ncbi:hypothetical protein CC80DRAFT_438498 [Byssothecium circinans]|uniref:RRM domain-containing protein n=1 Tax=Byssothecium circinans TaxID=147558 RepID=A0A6A5U5C9_9PLEO|nr:hypothetical protein CC80DRAFT_438498 [Byssothecium circinans]